MATAKKHWVCLIRSEHSNYGCDYCSEEETQTLSYCPDVPWQEVNDDDLEALKKFTKNQHKYFRYHETRYILLVRNPVHEKKISESELGGIAGIKELIRKDEEKKAKAKEAREKKAASAEKNKVAKQKAKDLKQLEKLKKQYEKGK